MVSLHSPPNADNPQSDRYFWNLDFFFFLMNELGVQIFDILRAEVLGTSPPDQQLVIIRASQAEIPSFQGQTRLQLSSPSGLQVNTIQVSTLCIALRSVRRSI